MSSDITLSASIRSSLSSLNTTTKLAERTQNRLSTGNKVNSALDDATAYFQAKALTDRSDDMSGYKSNIDQAISTLTAASNATDSIDTILKQIKGNVISARTADTATKADLQKQVNELMKQVNNLITDSSYQGTNLLTTTTQSLTVNFSEKSGSRLTVQGRNILMSNLFSGSAAGKAASMIMTALLGGEFSNIGYSGAGGIAISNVDNITNALDSVISKVRATASNLGGSITFLQTRLDFTTNYSNTLTTGAGKLTLADVNEEGANLVSLQTRQQLALQALNFAGTSEKNILQLFQ